MRIVNQFRDAKWPRRLAVACAVALGLALTPVAAQEGSAPVPTETTRSLVTNYGALFDAVVEQINKAFWDRERLASTRWLERAPEMRPEIAAAASLTEAARRINAYLDELKMSHTVLLTPDDPEYYILKNVFGGETRVPGIGLYSVRIDGRDFVDGVLEGFSADKAGLKVGDEIVSVDGAPYHPVRSFRGKVGRHAAVGIRRTAEGAVETVSAEVLGLEPLDAFAGAVRASARIIERDGRRIAYVHVWASTGGMEEAVADALAKVGLNRSRERRRRADAGVPVPDALVFDMRGKIGGNSGVAARYLELIDPRGPNMTARGPKRASWSRSVRGHNAVLIDHHVRSTGELFAHAYKRERLGPLIGTRTAGAVSAGWGTAMPLDTLLHVATTGLEVDGEVLEGVGVVPDIEVKRPVPYANGADPVLEAALAELVRGLAKDERRVISP